MRGISLKAPLMGPLGYLALIFVMLIAVQGVILLVISSQNLDLKSFFVAFNQSVVENRQRSQEDAAFRELQLQIIQEQTNRTRQLMPLFVESTNDINNVVNVTTELSDLVRFLRANFNESMLQETYKEYAATQEMNNRIERIEQILNGTYQ